MERIKYVLGSDEAVLIEDGEDIVSKLDKYNAIKISGNNFLYAAKRLERLGFRVLVKIDDFLREDLNIYDNHYSLQDFLNKIGEDYAEGITRMDVYLDRAGCVSVYNSGLSYVEIFSPIRRSSMIRVVSDVRGMIVESFLEV